MTPDPRPNPERRPAVRFALIALAAATVLALVVLAARMRRDWTWHLLRVVLAGLLLAAYVLSLIP